MADPTYILRIQQIRDKNVRARAKGKDLTFTEVGMIDIMRQNKVPVCMKHCVIKVFLKVAGADQEKFLSAFNICGAVFKKNGYMGPNVSGANPAQTQYVITLTGKGMRNNTRHRLEKEGGKKNSEYNALQSRLWQGYIDRRNRDLNRPESKQPPPGGKPPPRGNGGAPVIPPLFESRPATTSSLGGSAPKPAPSAQTPQKPGPANLIGPTSSTRKSSVEE